jgi:hypothetical protein
VASAVTEPDIAVLLVATSVYTDVPVVVAVMPPEVMINTRFQVRVTALPEIEPLTSLRPILAPALSGTWTVPEIEEPV